MPNIGNNRVFATFIAFKIQEVNSNTYNVIAQTWTNRTYQHPVTKQLTTDKFLEEAAYESSFPTEEEAKAFAEIVFESQQTSGSINIGTPLRLITQEQL